ncbi:major facilitator superfamily domain-containing protein [Apiospora marii]|uniref:Major facilitator superfamily domain-containing protein n=1 Tax=Apiospora marii TaxID=335849 RepID=A0ABR1SH63_9PEZI
MPPVSSGRPCFKKIRSSVINHEKPASNGNSRNGSSPADLAHLPASPATAPLPSSSVPSGDQAKLLHKINFHVLPILFVVYVVALAPRQGEHVQRPNSGPAGRTWSHGAAANNSLTIFFVPYILFEIPSNIQMKRFSPHVWLSGGIFIFAAITIAQLHPES